jgi:hypothetical protein
VSKVAQLAVCLVERLTLVFDVIDLRGQVILEVFVDLTRHPLRDAMLAAGPGCLIRATVAPAPYKACKRKIDVTTLTPTVG